MSEKISETYIEAISRDQNIIEISRDLGMCQ